MERRIVDQPAGRKNASLAHSRNVASDIPPELVDALSNEPIESKQMTYAEHTSQQSVSPLGWALAVAIGLALWALGLHLFGLI